jgi:hypothetical protein
MSQDKEWLGFISDPAGTVNQIRNLLDERYKKGFPIVKEIIQNANDGQATELDFGVIESLGYRVNHPLLKCPALFFLNNGNFKEEDRKAIARFGIDYNAQDKSKIGKFGLGQKSVFHFCEAFFFIAVSEYFPEGDGRFIDPWATDKDYERPDWVALSKDDRENIIQYFSEQNLINESNKDQFFILWIPLRQKSHFEIDNRCIFSDIYDSDSIQEKLNIKDIPEKIALIYPMLSSLKQIRYWENEQELLKLIFKININQECLNQRCIYPYADQPDQENPKNYQPEKHDLQGIVTIDNLENNTYICNKFVGQEEILDYEYFKYLIDFNKSPNFEVFWKDLKASDTWTKRLSLDSKGYRKQNPEKSIPHSAVVFCQIPAKENTQSKLSIQWSVFLPLSSELNEDEYEEKQCNGSFNYTLILHGYFFIDSGRTGLKALKATKNGSLSKQTPTNSKEMEEQWNHILITEGTLKLILPSLENFVKIHQLKTDDIKYLCKALKDSQLFKSQNFQESIYSEYQWIYCIKPERKTWELIDVDKRVLTLPPIPDWAVFTKLGELSNNVYFTLKDKPNLCPKNKPDKWDEEDILAVLESLNSETIFTKEEHIKYLKYFLEESTKNKLSSKIQDKLAKLLKKGLSMGIVEDLRESIKSLISLIDKNKLFVIDCDQDILQSIYQLELEVLVIHTDFNSDKKPDQNSNQLDSAKDAISILKCLTNMLKQENNQEKQTKVYNLIKFVLKSANKHLQTVFEKCSNLPIEGENLETSQQEKTSQQEFYTLSEIQASNFFAKSGKNNNLAKSLQKALATQEIILLDKEMVDIFNKQITINNSDSCLNLLTKDAQLSEPQKRLELLKELLNNV